MRTLLPNKERYYNSFADTVYRQYRQMRYGIATCAPAADAQLALVRKELVDWQSNEDAGALSEVNLTYKTWLPVEYDDVLYSQGGAGYIHSSQPTGPGNFGVNFVYGNTNQNIIEVNSGGCITRINLNPSINISQNSAFQYTQSVAATMWDIQHNMGITPNVFTEDQTGTDIEGIIEVVDANRIKIHFNQAVAGKAFLS